MRLEDATVLLVDDLPTLRELFTLWLTRCGCAVLTAEDGAEAIRLLTTQRVDAILSDITMPVMDGVTLAVCIRALQLTTPVLLFSGSELEPAELQRIHALGIETVLTKPLNRQALIAELERVLSS